MEPRFSLSVVIPVYNEEENIKTLYTRLYPVLVGLPEVRIAQLVFVDDGSADQTVMEVKRLPKAEGKVCVDYIELSRNFGHQVAVTAGLDSCEGDRVVIIDADLQDPPELIPQLLAEVNNGYDVVYARRRARRGESWLKRITAKWFYRLLSRITSVDIPLDTGDFRVISRVGEFG